MLKINWSGRLGNILLENVGGSILSEKYDLKTDYFGLNVFECLGFKPFMNGKRVFDELITVADSEHDKKMDGTDEYIIDLLNKETLDCGINYLGNFQNGDFLLKYRNKILSLFNPRYETGFEEDIYIHVRLGDLSHVNPGLEYYRKCLMKSKYRKIYLSTDSLEHEIISKLKQEFPITIYNDTPVNTINFAKNFGKLILSKGTFSWWIGFLSKAEKIYYPKELIEHPKIFVFEDWTASEK